MPEDITIEKITSEHVKIADSVWPKKSAWTLNYLERMAELNTNAALTKAGKLVAWCFR